MKKTLTFIIAISIFVLTSAQTQIGIASFYGTGFHGKPTASGEKYSQNALTAAHKTLPLGTILKVTNIENNKSVFVKVNDRGPFVKGRIIDLSTKAADILGYRNKGTARVKIEIIKPESIPADLLSASAAIAQENGIQTYDTVSVSRQLDKLKNTDDTLTSNEEPLTTMQKLKEKGETTTPSEKIPQPATEAKIINDTGIINRSKYFIITQLDKSKSGFYGLQLGVFSDPSLIFSMIDELEKYKQTLLIQQDIIDGKAVYKLYVGKFQNRAYADALKLILVDKFKEAIVLKYE